MGSAMKIKEVLGSVGGKIFYDEPMSQHSSLRVGGRADALIVIESEVQLAQIVRKLQPAGIDYLPVGNLTNIIVRDGGYRGAILLMSGLREINYRQMPDGGHYINAQGGAALAQAAALAAANELTGLEFCSGIPGSIGGAVWMNAGAYGAEMKDVIEEVSLLDANGLQATMKKEEIVFSYRRTSLPRESIILNARLKLEKGERKQIQDKMKEILQARQQKHPLAYPNAGSIFKNIPGMPAGRIIEEMGLKGKRCGDAEVSVQHANFIINRGKATATDVLSLISLIADRAKKEKGIDLETEVEIVGDN
ncbi:MAG: UDP-N-acetylenolpyruvoylglucosamine reductase [Deltaproteobacteria bacterium HGW-Deltaproteobacteria-12]|jgi:UDP-N-acetylmuramate dehydrogenase|nr:MAG: UDP-N-acetylenolpyruvoylglucosamine reductase [Deltaproteobacteria bacterium HGW-Deltaproteobacteria-12]